jgi:uncharacterized protein (TIGR02246 family)
VRGFAPFLALALVGGCKPGTTSPVAIDPTEASIRAVMRDSAEGWNRGDLDRFMAAYADDPKLTFVSGDGIIRGKATISGRYARSFAAGGNRRGTLSFTFLDFRKVGSSHAHLVARYRLRRPNGEIEEGPTSLLFRRTGEGWRIIADHSG